MTDRSDLGEIGDRLEQVEAILTYVGAGSRRLIAVSALLQDHKAENMPTRGMRRLWIGIAETMLKLDREAATPAEVADLLRQIEGLRRAVRAHEADISS